MSHGRLPECSAGSLHSTRRSDSRAAEAGTETAVAAARMFESQLFARIPTGQWYKNAAGDWVQK